MLDQEDVQALRKMNLQQRAGRVLDFIARAREFKIMAVRAHHPGWSEEKLMNEVQRWVRAGMKPEEF